MSKYILQCFPLTDNIGILSGNQNRCRAGDAVKLIGIHCIVRTYVQKNKQISSFKFRHFTTGLDQIPRAVRSHNIYGFHGFVSGSCPGKHMITHAVMSYGAGQKIGGSVCVDPGANSGCAFDISDSTDHYGGAADQVPAGFHPKLGEGKSKFVAPLSNALANVGRIFFC